MKGKEREGERKGREKGKETANSGESERREKRTEGRKKRRKQFKMEFSVPPVPFRQVQERKVTPRPAEKGGKSENPLVSSRSATLSSLGSLGVGRYLKILPVQTVDVNSGQDPLIHQLQSQRLYMQVVQFLLPT